MELPDFHIPHAENPAGMTPDNFDAELLHLLDRYNVLLPNL
jgi:hypothetical protein